MKNSPVKTIVAIAIGEVGLDYYWSREFEKEQLTAFEQQVAWSIETRLPLMIHCRKAQQEMVHLLKHYEKDLPGGVFHCFTGNEKEAAELALKIRKMPLAASFHRLWRNASITQKPRASVQTGMML